MSGLLQATYPTGRLSILGTSGSYVSLHTHGWNFPNLLPLWRKGDKRGADRVISRAPGARGFPRRRTPTRYSLEGAVCGEVTQAGVANADPWVGLQVNLDFLHDELTATPSGSSGTRAARLTMPSGADFTANVHVLDLIPGRSIEGENQVYGHHGVLALVTLELDVLSGGFWA